MVPAQREAAARLVAIGRVDLDTSTISEEDALGCQPLQVLVERIRQIEEFNRRVVAYDALRRANGRVPLPATVTQRTTLLKLQSLLRMKAVEEAERNHNSVPQVNLVGLHSIHSPSSAPCTLTFTPLPTPTPKHQHHHLSKLLVGGQAGEEREDRRGDEHDKGKADC